MTYIDELIKGNCPNGVEWKTLGELCKIETGKLNANAAIDGGRFPFFTTAKEISWINTYRWDEEALLIAGNANVGDVKYYSGKFEAYQRTYVLTEFDENIQVKYLYHYIRYDLKRYLELNTKKAAMSYIVLSTLKEFQIPLPPIEIQKEIVKILDKFTEYVTELTAELTERQKQYSFYRDKLLSFEDEVYQVEWKTLGEMAENLDYLRKPVTKGSRSSGRYPYYGASGIVDYVDDYIFDGDYLLVSEDGANLIARKTPIAFSVTGKSWINNHAHVLKFESDIDRKYVSYYLNHIDLTPYISGAAQPKLNQQNLNSIKLAYPKQEVRNRIVQVLDNFDAVCNDLNIGLPKEIELRQKQYDYFREKLLTFTAEGVYTDSTVQYRQDLIRLLQWVFGPIRVELGAVARYSNQKISTVDLSPKSYIGVDNLLQNRAGKLDATYLPENVKVNIYEEGNVLIGNIRPYLKKIWFATNSGGASPDVLVVQNQVKDCLVNRYLYHILANDRFFEFDMKNAKGSKMPRGDKGAVLHYQFILPTFSDQSRIVAILDKFDELTTSISKGLPKEIELRQKQYEYFRDILLNFPNKYE